MRVSTKRTTKREPSGYQDDFGKAQGKEKRNAFKTVKKKLYVQKEYTTSLLFEIKAFHMAKIIGSWVRR